MSISKRNASLIGLLALVVAFVGGAAGLILVAGTSNPVQMTATGQHAEQELSMDQAPSAATVDDSANARTRVISADDGLPTLEVTVKDSLETPLVDATVEARVASDYRSLAPSEIVSSLTDMYGHALLRLPLHTRYVVTAQKPGYGQGCAESGPGSLGFVLQRTGTLAVTTRDARTNELVGGVSIDLRDARATCHRFRVPDSGTILVQGVAPGPCTLSVFSECYLAYDIQAVVVPAVDSTNHIDIPLFRGRSIRGVVLDGDTGTPLKAGMLEYRPPPDTHLTTTELSCQGQFVLHGQDRIDGTLRIIAPSYHTRLTQFTTSPEYDAATGEQIRDAIVRVSRVATLFGVVLADGRPVKGALVFLGVNGILQHLFAENTPTHKFAKTSTHADGSFQIAVPSSSAEGANTGNWDVLVIAPGYAPQLSRLTAISSSPLTVSLSAGEKITVRVRNVDGAPEANAEIALTLQSPFSTIDNGPVLALLCPPLLTDASGTASITGLCQGLWKLEARSQNGSSSAYETIHAAGHGSSEIDITLDGSHVVSGIVVDTDGAPVEDARITWVDGLRIYEASTSARGRFTLHLPRSGETTVGVIGKRLSRRFTFVVRGGGEFRMVVETRTLPHSLHCTIVDSVSQQRIATTKYVLSFGVGKSKQTNKTTQYVRGGICDVQVPLAASGTLTFESDGYQAAAFSLGGLEDHDALEVSLEPKNVPDDSRVLRVRVSAGLVMVDVRAFDTISGEEFARADPITEAEFSLDIGSRRSATIVAQSVARCTPQPFLWQLGDSSVIELQLAAGGGRVRGLIRDAAFDCIKLEWPNGLSMNLDVNLDGYFASLALPAGTYGLSCRKIPLGVVAVRAGETSAIELQCPGR